VYDLTDASTSPVKASDMHESLSLNRLVKRLGPYVPPALSTSNHHTHQSYDKHLPIQQSTSRDPHQRELRRQARAKARRDLRERYAHYKSTFGVLKVDPLQARLRFTGMQAHARRQRREVRETVKDAATRKALYSVIAFETLRHRERLRQDLKQERDALRANPLTRRLSFREWVAAEAAEGDAAAISQLRGWAYAERREARQLTDAATNPELKGFRGPDGLDPIMFKTSSNTGFTSHVRRNGTVVYRNDAGLEVMLDHGSVLEVLPEAVDDVQALTWACQVAQHKFADQAELVGSVRFQEAAAAHIGHSSVPADTGAAGQGAQAQQGYTRQTAKPNQVK
jgi:hypothetical protein